MTTPTKKRVERAIKKLNKAQSACALASSTLRYATDDNGGWATPKEEHKLRLRRHKACAKAARAKVAFESVLRRAR